MADLGNLFFTLGLSTKDFDKKMEDEITRAKELKKMLQEALKGTKLGISKKAAEAARVLAEANRINAEASKTAAQAERERVKAALEALKLKEKENGEIKKINEAQAQNARLILSSNGHLSVTKRLIGEIGTYASMYFSIFTAQNLLSSLIRIRGEFDMQYISLKAILQSGEQATKLFEQIKGLAVVSPFKFMDLTTYAKQLSAYQIPTNELYDTTKKLADLSSGLGVGMDRIILAYGQVRSAAFLRGQELRQFTEAGIPMVDELANKFTKLTGKVTTAGDVFAKITKREVPFQMVKEVIDSLTSEGGKFYNMQEKQAESLKGKVSNLADQYDLMMNRIGESNDKVLKGGVDMLTTLMQHSEQLITVIKDLALAFGLYKVYTMMQTSAMGSNLSIMTAEEAKMRVKRANLLEEARLYRQLTFEEESYMRHGVLGNTRYNFSEGILGRGYSRLTQSDYVDLASNDRISKNEILRLGYLGKINQASMVELATNGKISAEEMKHVTLMRQRVSQGVIVNSLSKLGLDTEKLTNGVIAARLALVKIGQSLMMAFSTIFNPATLILGGGMAIWSVKQNYDQQKQKIKDDAKQLKTDMKEEWNDIQKFISDHPIEIAIKGGNGSISEYIKQYEDELLKVLPESTANAQIAMIPFGADGKQLSLDEQLVKAKSLLEAAQQAKSIIQDNATAFADAANSTNGIFSDGLLKNFDQLVGSIENWRSALANLGREDVLKNLSNPMPKVADWMKNNTEDVGKLNEALRNTNVSMQSIYNMVLGMQKKSGVGLVHALGFGDIAVAMGEISNPDTGRLKDAMDDMGKMVDDFKKRLADKNIDWASAQGKDIAETFKQKFFEQNSITGENEQTMFSFMFDEKMYGKTDAAFTLLAQRMKSSADQNTKDVTNKFIQDGVWSDAMVKAIEKAKDECISKFPMFKDELQKSWGVVNFQAMITTALNAQSLTAWQEELLSITKGKFSIEIKTATNVDEALSAIEKKYKEIKQFMLDQKPLMIRIGYKFDGKKSTKDNSYFNSLTGQFVNTGNAVESSIEDEYIDYESIAKAGAELEKRKLIQDPNLKGQKTNNRDTWTENLKRDYEQLKTAIQKYNELLKSMGSDEAMSKIKEAYGFAINSKYLTASGLMNLANDYMKKNSKKTETAKGFKETLINDRTSAFTEYDKNIFDAQSKSILNSIQIDKEQYKVYDDMFAKLGDARMAAVMAFGKDTKPYNTLVDMLKARFSEMADKLKMGEGFSFEKYLGMNPDEISKLPSDIQKLGQDIKEESTSELSQLRQQFITVFTNTDDSDIRVAVSDNLRKSLLDGLKDVMKGANGAQMADAKKAINAYYDKQIADINFEKFKKNISWDVVFSGLADATRKTLRNIRDELQNFINSPAFKSLSPNNQKTVIEKLNSINDKLVISDSTLTSWGKLYQQWKAAREELEKAVEAQKKINENPNSTEEQRKNAANRVTNASNNLNFTGGQLDASTKKVTNLSSAIVALGNSSNTSLVQIWNFADAMIQAFSKGENTALSKVGGIIGAILAILDSIGNQDVDEWAKKTANKIFNAIGSLFNSKYSLLHYLAGGLLGAKNKNYDDDMKDLTDSNQSLEKAIDRLTEKMKDAYTEELTSTYKKELENYKTQESNMRKQMQESGGNYSNGLLGLGGRKSSNHSIDQGMTAEDWAKITATVDRPIKSADAFWNLTSSEMLEVYDKNLDLYIKIKDLANDGYSDAAQYMDDYIALAEKEKKLLDEFKERETSTTVDQITSEYSSALDSMNDMTQTFSNNFTKTLRTAIINAFMQDKYMKNKIQKWYDKLAELMSNGVTGPNGSALSADEISALKNGWVDKNNNFVDGLNGITEAAKEEQKALKELGLYSDQTASSTSGGIKGITEETADLLASYINAIRADVAYIRDYYMKLVDENYEINADVIATISADVARIAANTLRSANNTDSMVNWMDSVTMVTSKGKALRT